MEVWRPVVGYEGLYEVSSFGQVRSLRSGINLRQYVSHNGYRTTCLSIRCEQTKPFIHRLVAAAFIGPLPEGKQVNHKSGMKSDNSVCNLEYVTPSENKKHAFRIGLQSNRGSKHSQAKLTDDKVREIRAMLNRGTVQSEVAKMMDVSPSAISRVGAGKRWGHVAKAMCVN